MLEIVHQSLSPQRADRGPMSALSLLSPVVSARSDTSIPDFSNWLKSRCERVDVVVALARAAPRLLQYYSIIDEIDRPVFCERAISFLPDDYFQDRSVLLFDDSISFGSTMDNTRRRLLRRGARVECCAVAVDREGFLGEDGHSASRYSRDLNADFLEKLTAQQLRVMHAEELRLFNELGKPYLFDFPIFEADLRPEIGECSRKHIGRRLGESPDRPYIWPSTVGADGAIYSIGVPVPADFLSALFPTFDGVVEWQQFSKIRLFFDIGRLKLRVVALAQVSTTPNDSLERLRALDDANLGLRLFLDAIGDRDRPDANWLAAVHRAVVFHLSQRLAATAWHSLIAPSLGDLLISEVPVFSIQDAAFLVGPDLARAVGAINSTIFSSAAPGWFNQGKVIPLQRRYDDEPPPSFCSNPPLWSEMAARLKARPELRPSLARDAYENIGYLAPALYEVIDRDERVQGDADRLLRGLTFSELLVILNS